MKDNEPGTHSGTQALAPIEQLRGALAGGYFKQMVSLLGSEDKARRFMTSSIEYVRRTPKLLECDRTSLMMSLIQVAQYNFLPSNAAGEAYLVPYAGEAKFQLGYQGIVTLLGRADVNVISAVIVYENDHFEYQEGLEPILEHKPTPFGDEKGEPIGVYTVFEFKGVRTFKVMDKGAVMKIKAMSKGSSRKESPWNSNDPELWMWKKTCLIQHSKILPKSAEIHTALAADYEMSTLHKDPKLDVEGPGAGKASHKPEEQKDTAPSEEASDDADESLEEVGETLFPKKK